MKASDLSSSDKRRLLDELRRQIGDLKYDELVAQHSEDTLLDMILRMSNEESASKKESDWDRAVLVCFGFLWLILTIGVASLTDITTAVLFFFSPSLYFVIFGLPGIVGQTLADRLPWGCGLIVALILIAIIVGVAHSIPEEFLNKAVGMAFLGTFAAWIVVPVAEFIVKLGRGKRT